MSEHRVKFTQGARRFDQKVELDGVDVSSAVRVFRYEAHAMEVPTVQLELIMVGTDLPEAVCEVSLLDTHETINLRSYLAEACDLCEKLLTLMSDDQIAEILKTRDTARQIRLWKVHADGPDRDTSLRTYREKVRSANLDPDRDTVAPDQGDA